MINKYKLFIFFLIFCISAGTLPIAAQNSLDRQAAQVPYQIPQTVYVGDRAMLVLPLPDLVLMSDIDLNIKFSLAYDIEFHRIALENRSTGSRLVIEFTAFVPC